jgi:hypothetical protein
MKCTPCTSIVGTANIQLWKQFHDFVTREHNSAGVLDVFLTYRAEVQEECPKAKHSDKSEVFFKVQ